MALDGVFVSINLIDYIETFKNEIALLLKYHVSVEKSYSLKFNEIE